MAVGENGTIITSSDGVSWTTNNSGVADYLLSVVFAHGIFVAVGGDYGLTSTILTSTNGIDWQSQNSGITFTLQNVSYGNGTFVAVTASSIPIILTSLDGAVWNQWTADIADWPICYIAYGDSTFVAAGSMGGILQSASTTSPILSLQNIEDGTGRLLTVTGEAGRNYRLQYCSKLQTGNWNDILSFTNDSPVTTLTNYTYDWQRFYRVVSP